MKQDIFSQAECLDKFVPQKMLPESRQRSAIFCGNGDSLAAAMLAEAHSDLRTHAADPLDLAKNRSILKGRDLYLISISGQTVSNIRAAELADRSAAITSYPQSRLAHACKSVIQLQFPNSDIKSAGTVSFLDSALCCVSMVRQVQIKEAAKIFESAQAQSSTASYQNRLFILGNLHTYPLAMYAAAKMYEVLGRGASYQRIEQFSHMELFSVRPGDTVAIFEPPNRYNQRLAAELKSMDVGVVQPVPPLQDHISNLLFYTFFSQLVPLHLAGDQKDCYFLAAHDLLRASNGMIY